MSTTESQIINIDRGKEDTTHFVFKLKLPYWMVHVIDEIRAINPERNVMYKRNIISISSNWRQKANEIGDSIPIMLPQRISWCSVMIWMEWKYNAKVYGNGAKKLILRDIIFGSNVSAAFHTSQTHTLITHSFTHTRARTHSRIHTHSHIPHNICTPARQCMCASDSVDSVNVHLCVWAFFVLNYIYVDVLGCVAHELYIYIDR